jgi:hypothetical protein
MDDGSVEARVFRCLEGDWRLARTIPGRGSVAGTAAFRRVGPSVLRYREEGSLELPKRRLDVWREYDYVLEPGRIRVRLVPSGDTLHLLRLAAESGSWPVTATDVHVCALDTYDGEYRFESESRITIGMAVRGPAKGFRISTVLDRIR